MKNQICKIQFFKLDFSNLIFQKSSTDQQGVSIYFCVTFWQNLANSQNDNSIHSEPFWLIINVTLWVYLALKKTHTQSKYPDHYVAHSNLRSWLLAYFEAKKIEKKIEKIKLIKNIVCNFLVRTLRSKFFLSLEKSALKSSS